MHACSGGGQRHALRGGATQVHTLRGVAAQVHAYCDSGSGMHCVALCNAQGCVAPVAGTAASGCRSPGAHALPRAPPPCRTQVLQAWRQLLDSRQAAVLAALEATEWRARARQATAHPKHLVASAAAKLLPPPGLAPAHAPAAREGGAGVWEAEYSLAGPASALHGRLDAEEALACVQQLAAVQQPSASSASSGVPVPFQWAEGEALQAPIGPAMLDDPDMLVRGPVHGPR